MEEGGGCVRRGCGVLLGVFALFLVIGFISSLSPDAEETNTAQPSETTTNTATSRTIEEEATELETEEPIEPTTQEEESSNLAEVVADAPGPEEMVSRSYEWEYDGIGWSWELRMPKSMYEYFRGIPRPSTTNYSVYVTHPWDNPYIDGMVGKIREAAEAKDYGKYQMEEFAIAFVQSMPYTVDSVTSPYDEYPRYPAETLVDGGGDCEDTAILLASLLDSMGVGVVLLRLPEHMAVGVKGGDNVHGAYWSLDGDKYFYIETVGSGWRIGDLPDEYAGMSASIYTMQPVPIITHEWNLEVEGLMLALEVRIDNLGTAAASDVHVFAGFDAGDGMAWSSKQSDMFDLEPGHQVKATLGLLPPPSGVHTRLIVRIVMAGYIVNESYSTWIDT